MNLNWRVNKYYSIIILVVLLFFSVNAILGRVTFGYGLGDLAFYPFLWSITLIYVVLFFIYRNRNDSLILINVLLAIPSIWIVLTATIWRGGEYPWEGSILYAPCRTEVAIENRGISKNITVTMCSMEYYSYFTANWNGVEMTIIAGDVNIPEKLERYINYPIKSVLIIPEFLEQTKNDTIAKLYKYKIDTLKINMEYNVSGQIIKVINGKPVIRSIVK